MIFFIIISCFYFAGTNGSSLSFPSGYLLALGEDLLLSSSEDDEAFFFDPDDFFSELSSLSFEPEDFSLVSSEVVLELSEAEGVLLEEEFPSAEPVPEDFEDSFDEEAADEALLSLESEGGKSGSSPSSSSTAAEVAEVSASSLLSRSSFGLQAVSAAADINDAAKSRIIIFFIIVSILALLHNYKSKTCKQFSIRR